MTITVIGHGYVGLVTACIFADFGNQVWVIGHTKEKLARLKRGDPIIYEPGLKELLEKNIKAKRLIFTDKYDQAIPGSDIVFIAVGTPSKENGEADLSTVFEVARNVAKNFKKKFTVVSCKSTVPVGTNKKIELILNRYKSKNVKFAVASCPEFLREGSAIYDTLNCDRVVIGSDSKEAVSKLIELHQPIKGKRIITDLASAELIKYTSNAMLAMKISFANLISFFCEKTDADVETVLDAVGVDKRIGRIFMDPGTGYGGSCLPKDVRALIKIAYSLDIDSMLLEAIEKINLQVRENILNKILKAVTGKKIAVWGLSFKPNTDDVREAPSLFIIEQLLSHDYKITVYDPAAINNIKNIYGNKLLYSSNPYTAVKDADGLVIITEWNEFKQADLKKVKSLMKKPLIIDGRNIYDPVIVKKIGFTYISVGRKSINHL